ncbi:chemotaxis protein CheW [Massilia glaciei]|uniref:Chemotaxis protein CheW n=1 Tax=Massilia glaciei TaxID=1524097 RepID=A0A2U2HGI1_9BURK|nr:chemotaxis protein CheW [Massilia glaciei]PWF44044.1 hypothetical protein C7C56_019870 [Massilia glaciei]
MDAGAPLAAWVAAELGAMRLGVPVGAVVGALKRPAARVSLGRRRGAVCDVVTHLGRPLPVLDLGLWVEVGESAPGSRPRSLILVLRDGARMIGVLVDALEGVVGIAPDALVRTHHDASADEIFHSVAVGGEGDRPLSLLDVARLMALAQAWADDAPSQLPEAVGGAGEAAAAKAGQDWAVIESAGVRMAVPAVDVGELLAMPELGEFAGSAASGICHWRGRHVPVLDAGALFGKAPARTGPALLLTVCRAGLALGLAVDKVLRICRIKEDANGHARHPDAPLFVRASVIDEDGVPVNLIDTGRLMAMFPEVSISEVAAGGAHLPGAARTNSGAYIVYKAGATVASPIDGLEEVLPARAYAGGTMAWRGKAVALVDLRWPNSAAGNILVLRHQGRLAGILIDSVELLITPNSAHLTKVSLPGARFEMLTTGRGRDQASHRVLDLGQVVETRLAPGGAPLQAELLAS